MPRPIVLISNSIVPSLNVTSFEYRLAAVQSHQAVKKAQLPDELRVLLRLPAVSRHGDRDRLRALDHRKC